jgi:subtilisin family serine protease
MCNGANKMKKVIPLLLVCFVLALLLSGFVASETIKPEKKYDVIVKYKENAQNGVSSFGSEKSHKDMTFKKMNKEEMKQLESSDEVEYVQVNYKMKSFLQDSVRLINATNSWNLQTNGINLTGTGQTICIIDSGINYSHSDFGGCNINYSKIRTTNGTNTSYILENSNHPYNDSTTETYVINFTGFSKIAVHFVNISTETGYDFIHILDANNNSVINYSGYYTDVWSPTIEGDIIKIKLTSDSSVNFSGFYIDQIINDTISTAESVNWSGCSKIIGGYDFYNKDPDPMDDLGHGTHVAGIAMASGGISGIGFNAKAVALKVISENDEAYTSDIIKAINWCVGNSSIYNISVISMSLGTDCVDSPSTCYLNYCDSSNGGYRSAINSAIVKNISVIIATGNNGNYTSIPVPACIMNATRVGSVNKDNTVSDYSNRNWMIKLLSVGGNIGNEINSTSLSGSYTFMHGTSMAAPQVSGAIAIINQYLKSTGRTRTPKQIEDLLNNTGKTIFDSATGMNFSRINIYSALLSIDNQAPTINLISPINDILEENGMTVHTLMCNVSDWQLSNLSFYLWNSGSSLINQTSINSQGTFASAELNISNISNGRYYWNCYSCDLLGNCGFANNNYTLNVGAMSAALNSPINNTYANLTNRYGSFNCSGRTTSSSSLTNITFYLWDSTGNIINSSTLNVEGLSNYSIFAYNFSSEGIYRWNCLITNNKSNSTWGNGNLTFIYDYNSPSVSLNSPSSGNTEYHENDAITFRFTVSDTSEIDNCKLIIDNVVKDTKNSVTRGSEQSFSSQSFSTNGDKIWKVNCTDRAGNIRTSSSRTLSIQDPATEDEEEPTDEGDSGGDESDSSEDSSAEESASASETTTLASPLIAGDSSFVTSFDSVLKGYTKSLREGQKIRFVIPVKQESNASINTTYLNETHTITINEVNNNSVNLTVASTPVNMILRLGEERKIYFLGDYALNIRLNSIVNESANLTVKIEPRETSLTSSFFGRISKGFNNTSNWIMTHYFLISILTLVAVLIAASNFFVYRRIKKRENEKPLKFSRDRKSK